VVFTWTEADALFVLSATERAVTAKLPAVVPAVKRPLLEIVPPVAVQVTAVLELPVTVAVNCWVAPACTDAVTGEMLTLIAGAAWIVTLALADLVVSAAEVAVTVKLPAVAPAVKRPAFEIVPPVAVQLTAVFEAPVTVAVNCLVAPVCTDAVVGEMLTLTTGAAWTVTVALADLVESATEVAVTKKLPALAPAVNRPAFEIVPPVAVQLTAVFEVPVTAGVELHDILTVSLGGVGVIDHVVNDTGAPAQGANTIPVNIVSFP